MFVRVRHFLPVAFAVMLCLAVSPALALDASELALVVNHNMPDGMKLAELYAKQRNVPDRRIIELDLPKTEQMSFEVYERDVVPPIREFLRLNDPQHQVKCLVTFYGVPFRIAAHVDTAQETAELVKLRAQLGDVSVQIKSLADETDRLALSMDASFRPTTLPASMVPSEPVAGRAGEPPVAPLTPAGIEVQVHHIDHAGQSILACLQKMDPDERQAAAAKLNDLMRRSNAPIQFDDPQANATSPNTMVATSAPVVSTPDPLVAAMPLEDRRFDPASREQIRQEAARRWGLFRYAQLLLGQIGYLSPEDTEAATDSELSLLWWTFYPRARWQLNPLCYRFSIASPNTPLMVSRLDAPTPALVTQMILDSVHAEAQGLKGRMVIDARGLPLDENAGKVDSYAVYDDLLRQLAARIHLKTTLPLTFDDKAAVLPAHSVQDVALYCGWYSLGNYIPACSFVPGAVGFHIASFEMVSLRDPGNNGWVRGLLNDGIAATLGPVSEPYLQAFPSPDEFFPLLLTGKLTLAEVYWKTELLSSWRMCLVGDPLYTPFKLHPPMKVQDLPDRLQSIFNNSASAVSGHSAGSASRPTAARN